MGGGRRERSSAHASLNISCFIDLNIEIHCWFKCVYCRNKSTEHELFQQWARMIIPMDFLSYNLVLCEELVAILIWRIRDLNIKSSLWWIFEQRVANILGKNSYQSKIKSLWLRIISIIYQIINAEVINQYRKETSNCDTLAMDDFYCLP